MGLEEVGGVKGLAEPLGACYIAAVLEKGGHDTKVIHHIDETDEEIIKNVQDFEPDAVCFSTNTNNFSKGVDFAREVKSLGDIPIIFGGYHVTGCVEHYDLFPDLLEDVFAEPIDFVVYGEGERTIEELIKQIEKGKNFDSVKGIAYKENDEIKVNEHRERIEDLDSLPFAKRDDLPMNRYFQAVPLEVPKSEQRFASLYTSKGCRYNCNFCLSPVMFGKWKARSAKSMANEIDGLVGKYGTNFVWFADEDFLADKKRIQGFCEELEERNINIYWRSFLKATDIQNAEDEELLKYMYKVGYRAALIGIESTDDEILKSLNKGVSFEEIKKALEICDRVGISVRGTYMIGRPEEDKAELNKALEQLLDLPFDEIYLPFLTPFPGIKKYEDCRSKGLLTTTDFKKYNCKFPIIKSPIEETQLNEIREHFLQEFYFGKKAVTRMLRKIEAKPELARVYKEIFDTYTDI